MKPATGNSICGIVCAAVLSATTAGTAAARETMRSVFEAKDDYLLIPMGAKSEYTKMTVRDEDGRVVGRAEGLLSAASLPEWYAPFYISPYKGKKITFEYGDTLGGVAPSIRQHPFPHPGNAVLRDPSRPAFHLTAPGGWLASPAALVRVAGDWHAFWLHNPFVLGPEHGTRGMLHAVSKDLLSWEFKRPVGAPSESPFWPDGISNASAFFDAENRSGFFDKGGGTVFSFELPHRGTLIAFSADLQNFAVPTAETAIPGGAQSSQILYNPDLGLWTILRTEKKGEGYDAVLYSSEKLDEWVETCRIDAPRAHGNFQMRKIPMSGSPEGAKWVVMDGNGAYVVGVFEGKNFKILSKRPGKIFYGDINGVRFWENAGPGRTYASAGIVHKEKWFKWLGQKFTGCATMPYDLRLARLKDGDYQLRAYVPEEIISHVGGVYQTLGDDGAIEFSSNVYSIPEATGNKCMYQGRLFTSKSENFCIEVSASNYSYNYTRNTFTLSRYGELRSADAAQTPLNRYIVEFKGFVDTYNSEFILGAGEAVLAIGDAMLNDDQLFKLGTGAGTVFTDYVGKFPIFRRSGSARADAAVKRFLDLVKSADTARPPKTD